MNLFSILTEHIDAGSTQPFLCVPGQRVVSYGEMLRRSARFAAVLRDMGVVAGGRVLVQIEKSSDAVALYLACLRIGAVYVPLNPAYTARELEYFLHDASPRLLVHQPDKHMNVPVGVVCLTMGAAGEGELPARAGDASEDGPLALREPDDIAAMLYTSGTTGRSKGAQLTLANLASNAKTLARHWAWRQDDVLLHALPIFHIHGLFVALHCAMLGPSRVIFLPRFATGAVLDALPHATVMMGVPTFYTRLLANEGLDPARCQKVRLFISGSAPLSTRTFDAFERRSGHRILERYGMTETGMLASNPLTGARVAGTVGYALPGVEIRICDDAGSPLPPSACGSVEVRGPNVFSGYRGLPDANATAFRGDGFFVTGDLGQLAPDGRLTLRGRASELIISGGMNVYPQEVERCIATVHGVSEAAVFGVPHADLGEVPVAAIVADADAGRSDGELRQAVREALEENLARFKRPRQLFVLPALPRNAMGKIQKKELLRRMTRSD